MTDIAYPINKFGFDIDEMNFANDPDSKRNGRNLPSLVEDNSDVITLSGTFRGTIEWNLPSTPVTRSVIAVIEKEGKEWAITMPEYFAKQMAPGDDVITYYRAPAPLKEDASADALANAIAAEYHEPKVIGDFHSFPIYTAHFTKLTP